MKNLFWTLALFVMMSSMSAQAQCPASNVYPFQANCPLPAASLNDAFADRMLTPPPNNLGVEVPSPLPWTPQKHQNFGGQQIGHTLAWTDQNNVFTSDRLSVQTLDASVLWLVGLGGGGAGQSIGLQATIAGTTFNLYVNPTPASGVAAVGMLAATINGGVLSTTVATAGTNVTNGQKYALNVPEATCFVAPSVIATAAGGVMSAAAVTGTGGSDVWGGACTGTITNPVSLVGTNATVNVTQADTAFINADLAFRDANGFGYQGTASHEIVNNPTILLFDLPWGPSNSIKVCAATVQSGAAGVGCPAGTGWTIAAERGLALDNGPVLTMARNVPGRAPFPGDELANYRWDGQKTPTSGITAQYGSAVMRVGGRQVPAGATSASGTSITLSNAARHADTVAALQDGFYVADASTPCAIPNGTTIASGGGTINLVLSAAVECTGVTSADNLYFVDPVNPMGRLQFSVSDGDSGGNAGTSFIVSGAPEFDSGFNARLSSDVSGEVVAMGVQNETSAAGTGAGFNLLTGALCTGVHCSFSQKTLLEGASNSEVLESLGEYVDNYTIRWAVTAAAPAMVFDGAATTQFGIASSRPNHLTTGQATPPALTSCGGGSPAIVGTDTAATVTMGTTATGCVITFNVAYVAAPHCVVTWQATPLASQSYAVSNTAITLTQTSTSGNVVNYVCVGRAGG